MTSAVPVAAALLDSSRVDPYGATDAAGGLISRSMEDQIGLGQGDVYTPYSSAYIIARDPVRAVRRGRQLFQRKFSEQEGLGPRVNYQSSGDITSHRALGAGLSDSCSSCHGSPKGSAGFGGNVATFPDGRDAPHLFGLGIVEQLAEEMTEDLREDRRTAKQKAAKTGDRITRQLVTKGVDFGYLIVWPNGKEEYHLLEGVDSDLRVKPFFAQGKTASMREFINGAFKDEMGLESFDPVLCAATDPVNPQRVVSVGGFVYDPAVDTFERPVSCDASADNDGDGVTAELDPALIDYMEFYLLNYFKPGRGDINVYTRTGRKLMKSIGCTSCHVPSLTIDTDRRIADVETKYDAQRGGVFNKLYSEVSGLFEAHEDEYAYPKLLAKGDSFKVKNFFSDLKRHDLGELFHERDYDGSMITEHVTEPLWGVGSTAPYGHDGRSIDLHEVIMRHGGEAQHSRDAYAESSLEDQLQIQLFLRSLVIFPPDDTASNLNPGDPNAHPQDPAGHGNIKLPNLFTMPELGGE
ncbi:MAG: di-heme oxidoredictase family protein [Granulosicoccaceae bacterium]